MVDTDKEAGSTDYTYKEFLKASIETVDHDTADSSSHLTRPRRQAAIQGEAIHRTWMGFVSSLFDQTGGVY